MMCDAARLQAALNNWECSQTNTSSGINLQQTPLTCHMLPTAL